LEIKTTILISPIYRETFKMQSEEDQYRSTTTIDYLPDEVIELIFNKTSFQCVLICGLVSKRWLKVSNQDTPFMQKVHLNIQNGEDISERTFARTYKIISLGCLDPNTNYEKLLENCEKLYLENCRFKNMAQLAHLLGGCKNLKSLDLITPELAAYGLEGLEAAECCASHSAIDLVLILEHFSQWMVLRLFKIIQLDIGQLQITVEPNASASQLANMIDYVHHNHKSVFKVFNWNGFRENIVSPLRFNQLKQLMSLSIPLPDKMAINKIAENLIELKYLNLTAGTDNEENYFNLNYLKALTKLETLGIDVYSYGGELNLDIRELQQLKMLQVRAFNLYRIISGSTVFDMSLQFPDLTSQHALNLMENLIISDFLISRNVFQLIFRTMPNLQNLFIKNPKPNKVAYSDTEYYVRKRLARNKNGINRLKNLKTLNIDIGWIDESFLRNMKLPKLQSFSLLSRKTIPFWELSNIGLLYLAKQCPKLMEIRAEVPNKPVVLIASRKSADCVFNNQEVGETKNLNEVCFDDEDDNVNDDGECSDYSEDECDYFVLDYDQASLLS
jgi:hypothetical protein